MLARELKKLEYRTFFFSRCRDVHVDKRNLHLISNGLYFDRNVISGSITEMFNFEKEYYVLKDFYWDKKSTLSRTKLRIAEEKERYTYRIKYRMLNTR